MTTFTDMTTRYDWIDFEEDDSTDAVPDKFVLIIRQDEAEFATIIHRTVGGKYPINGELAEQKRRNAELIVAALNNGEEN